MPEFDIEFTDEAISSNAGIILIGNILCSEEFKKQILSISDDSSKEYTDYQILKSYLGLLSLGKSDFEAIDNYRDDVLFKKSLDLQIVPSKETLRQRIELLSKETVNKAIEVFNVMIIKHYSVLQTCLDTKYVPVDFDVTPFNNSGTQKEGVGLTYKRFDGYAPMITYIGATGFMVNNQLRKGTAHSNCEGTADYIRNTISYSQTLTDQPLLVRFDSGNDSVENILVINEFDNVNYLIKGNMRNIPKEEFISIAQGDNAIIETPRPGKTIYYNSTEILLEQKDEDGKTKEVKMRRVVRFIERTIDNQGQVLLIPEQEIDFWNTDLFDLSIKKVINLYADHGTSEQYHSEFKTEMDIERLPSGKFKTNSLITKLAMLTFNMLRTIGQQTLASGMLKRKREVKRIRIRKVIQDVMYMACKFMIRCKRRVIQIASYNPYGKPFIHACKTMFIQ